MADKDRSRRRSKASQMFGVDRAYPAKNKRIREQNRAINELRVAKEFEAGAKIKDFSKSDQKIFDNLLKRLGKKYGKKEGYQSRATLRDWINNKGGMRNKDQHEAGKVSLLLSTAAIADPKKTRLSKLKDERKQANIAEEINQRSRDKYQLAAAEKRVVSKGAGHEAEVFPKALRKRGDKSAVPASPTGTVYHGAKSKASVSPRGAVSKAPEVSSRTQTSKGKQLSPFETAFANARKKGLDVFPFKGKKYTTELASPSRKRKSPPPAPKRKPTQKVREEDKPSVKLEDWSGGVATAVRPPLKPLEGGVRYKKLPDWLGGGEIKIDSSDEAFDYENSDNVTHGKEGGQVKKGVKKTKTKARKRAALRGYRAELRGG